MSVTKEKLDEYIIAYQKGEPLISDEEYDDILEEYLREHGEDKRPFTRVKQSSSVNDIVGTLTKVYGVETPMREGQKTYKDWLRTKGINENDKRRIIVQPKFDGCSVAIDVNTGRFFTRGDYDNGESVDVTDLFDNRDMKFPEGIESVKFEAIMSRDLFNDINHDTYKRPRDMVSGTITSRNVDISQFITLIPLRESGNNHLYVPKTLREMSVECDINDLDTIRSFINDKLDDGAKVFYNDNYYEIDGVVVSVINDNDEVIDEIAIKILNNIQETKIIGIDYQYGKTGKITPVGILEPVKFGEITVDHVTLSTLNRVVEIGLHYGDTVRIAYNIVPYLLDSYHDGKELIQLPTHCPMCGKLLNYRTLKTVRCDNPHCKGLKIGMITRYCEKMKMMGLSKKTIEKLFENGLINTIGDLYRLTPEKVMTLDGFKEKSANNVCQTIKKASTNVSLTRWLGALPIKDISEKTWKLIIKAQFENESIALNVIHDNIMNGNANTFMTYCVPEYVYGFSALTYVHLKEGLVIYWEDIVDTFPNITFNIPDIMDKPPSKGRVTLTGTHDKDVISFIESKGYEVNDFSSKTIVLVIPYKEYVSSKVTKATKMGIPIYTVDEIYKGAL